MVMPLSMVIGGERVQLVNIRGGQRIRKRLAEMGFNIGMDLEVICRDETGPLIVAVKDSRMAIGRGMAHKIMVKPSPDDHQ